MASSPGSSDLSDLPSEDFDDQVSSRQSVERGTLDGDSFAPPAKRRKTGANARAWAYDRAASSQPPDDADEHLSVSEDSFGSAPGSPTHDEWTVRDEAQVECLWRDCDFGRALNNDELVQHVQGTHCATGGPKKTKYVCEWGECQKKTSNHPSGYALKAHMRSHTKEKPYYCALPECDKAFTRSDALAKHMRTVHEPEQVRGTGPGASGTLEPPSMAKKPIKLKLGNGTQSQPKYTGDPNDYFPEQDAFGNDIDPSPANDNITYMPAYHPITGQPGFMIHYPPDIHFSSWESSISADHLMRVLRRQLKWAQAEGKELEKTIIELEAVKRKEWTEKEALLQTFIGTEQARFELNGDKAMSPPDFTHLIDASDKSAGNGTLKQRRLGALKQVRESVLVKDEIGDAEDGSAMAGLDEIDDVEPETSPAPVDGEGGFDGEDDPYDNYLKEMMERFKQQKGSTDPDAPENRVPA